MEKYIRVYLFLSFASFHTFLLSRIGAILFLAGKVLRFIFFLLFLIFLVRKTGVLGGYNIWQIILFYLTFNFIDSATQMLFREVYRFRQQIINGNFDLILVKPVNPLFRVLFGGTDLLDFLTLFPFIVFIGFVISRLPPVTIWQIFLYLLFIANSLFIAMSFHILVLALAIVTTEVDHAIMIYRDVTGLGKLPIEIYREPVKSLITFVLPVGIMMSFPSKILFGLLNLPLILISIGFSTGLYILSIYLWRLALKHYTSASS